MIKRTISTLVLWAILVATIYFFRARGFAFLMMLLALLSSFEACNLLKKCNLKPSFKWVACATLFMFLPFICGGMWVELWIVGLMLILVIPTIACLFSPYDDFIKTRVLPTALCVICIPTFLSFLSILSFKHWTCHESEGLFVVIWVIGAAKFCDVGGYLFGCLFGKHKIAPTVSPKKSWEGLFGGMFLSGVFSFAMTYFWPVKEVFFNQYELVAIASFVIAPISLVSDLLESALKRRAGEKDSGNTIPGIGGALDLADSILLCCPVAFVVFYILAWIPYILDL